MPRALTAAPRAKPLRRDQTADHTPDQRCDERGIDHLAGKPAPVVQRPHQRRDDERPIRGFGDLPMAAALSSTSRSDAACPRWIDACTSAKAGSRSATSTSDGTTDDHHALGQPLDAVPGSGRQSGQPVHPGERGRHRQGPPLERTAVGLSARRLWTRAETLDVVRVQTGVPLATDDVDQVGVQTVLSQPVAAPDLVERQ